MPPPHEHAPHLLRPALSGAWKLWLIAGFVAQLGLIVFVTAIGLSELRATDERLHSIVAVHMRRLELTKIMYAAARERTLSLVRMTLIEDPFLRDEEVQDFYRQASQFAAARGELLALPITDAEIELLKRQGELTSQAVPLQDAVIDLSLAGKSAQAQAVLMHRTIPAQDGVLQVLNQLDDLTRQSASAALLQASEAHSAARNWMFALSAAALLLGMLVASLVVRQAHRAGREREQLATHDTLTGLPNRMLLIDRLEQAILHAKRHKGRLGVLFIDLDRFKLINDSLGHDAGDELIRQVGARLQRAVRAQDVVARLGGDEFVVGVADVQRLEDVLNVVEKVMAALTHPYLLAGREIFTTCSLGVGVYPEDGASPLDLLKNADTAMYHAKEAGKNRFQLFNEQMNTRAAQRLEMETDLRYALERDEFELHYQPQLALGTGRPVALEALLRWRHPRQGLLAPGAFLELLEDTGLIIAVGARLFRAACGQCADWHGQGHNDLVLAFNLSSKEFWHGDLIATIQAGLAQSGMDPARLQIELTEGILMQDVPLAIERMKQLRALGIQLSVDDFGTGYSCLAHLKRFPVDELKIDRFFIKDILTRPEEAELVRAILALGESLSLRTVVEGVESEAQLALLRSLGAQIVQGYLISQPLPADQVVPWLDAYPAQ